MSTNQDFNKAVEKYMLLDKKTLAELLALKELEENNNYDNIDYPLSPNPYIPYQPINPYPFGPIVTYCTSML